jgi:glycosyltransferase involved in cell wall biosynthesis
MGQRPSPVTISVLIRSLGIRGKLETALHSLSEQTFKKFEVVLVEDGPATLELFLRRYKNLRIKYVALGERQGRTAAGNRALALSRGEFCIFLDEDDLFYPDHLDGLIQVARKSGARLIRSWSEERAVTRDDSGNINRVGRLKRWRRDSFSLGRLTFDNYIPIHTVLFHRSLYEAAGGFSRESERLEDWFLWVRYSALAPDWAGRAKVTAVYHVPLNWREALHRRRSLSPYKKMVRQRARELLPGVAASPIRSFGVGIYNYFAGYYGGSQ